MADKLVVKSYSPTRRWVAFAAALFAVSAGLYATYEFGRYRAGFDSLESRRERGVLNERLTARATEVATLEAKVVQLETMSVGQNRERAEVQRTIGELQAKVATLNQELAFYRGIVTQGANATEVKIQQLRIAATEAPGKFRVILTLVQPVRPDTVVSGSIVFAVEGTREGKTEKADFSALTAGKTRELPFSFRYLENIDQEITLPSGLKPVQLTVEVRSNRRGVTPLQQSLIWNVEAA
jgi:hypothetical protein